MRYVNFCSLIAQAVEKSETFDKPANGFEPMAFALQKRCSTTELSRQEGWAFVGELIAR